MIEALCVERFRGLEKACISGFRRFTVISGGNGAGKSTFLEAIYVASALMKSFDDLRGVSKLDYLVSRRGGRGKWDDSRHVLWHRMATSAPISLSLWISGTRYDFSVTYNSPASSPVYVWLNTGDGLVNYEVSKMILRGSGEEVVYRKQPEPPLSLLSSTVFVDQQLLQTPERVEKTCWPKLIASRLDKRITAFLRSGLMTDAEGLTYAPLGDGYSLFIQTSKTSVRLEDAGEGVKNSVLLYMLILALKPKLLLLDDPEFGMDPDTIYAFGRLLAEVSKETDTQTIIATRSLELLEITEALRTEAGKEVAALLLEKVQRPREGFS